MHLMILNANDQEDARYVATLINRCDIYGKTRFSVLNMVRGKKLIFRFVIIILY